MGNNLAAPAKISCITVSPHSEQRKYKIPNNISNSNNSNSAQINVKKKPYRLPPSLDFRNSLYAGTNYCPENGLFTAGDRLQYTTSPINCLATYPDSTSCHPIHQPIIKRHPEFSGMLEKHQQSTKPVTTAYSRSSLNGSLFVALHDYTARVEDDLCMTKGQEFKIIDRSQGYWWYANCLATGSLGYVPFNYLAPVKSLESNEWFFGEMRRLQAEHCLLRPGNAHGSFLVRVSESRSGEYSLSVRDADAVKHYRIRSRASRADVDLRRVYISRQLPFVNIQQLVEHYTNSQSGLCCQLVVPSLRPTQPVPTGSAHNLVDKWEIPKSSVVLKERIGKGQFGQVYRAILNGTTLVAVKTLRASFCNVEDFLMEAQTMKRLQHPHLIQLYAVCTQSAPFYLVTELMSRGSLLSFLQSGESRNALSMLDLVLIAAQIASGMAYLESQHYIHRDLAARNVLVCEGNLVKIADFGLARMIQNAEYVAHVGARFPIKWTAPEAANYSRFTIKSDVWSFGILLTEIVTFGRVPYPGMHNAEVLRQVEAGYRMPAPANCSPDLYDLMLECWAADEGTRPSFSIINTRLEHFCNELQSAYKNPGTPCDTVVPSSFFFDTHHPPTALAVSP